MTGRRVFVADSFRGLPRPDTSLYPKDEGDRHHEQLFLNVSREEVERNFRLYDLLDDQVVFLEGWFKDTLANSPIRTLAVLRLDGDMYESTIQVLDSLYDKVSVGGFIIIDDYCLKNCKQAVHDFRNTRGIDEEIIEIDGTGAFWRRQRG